MNLREQIEAEFVRECFTDAPAYAPCPDCIEKRDEFVKFGRRVLEAAKSEAEVADFPEEVVERIDALLEELKDEAAA